MKIFNPSYESNAKQLTIYLPNPFTLTLLKNTMNYLVYQKSPGEIYFKIFHFFDEQIFEKKNPLFPSNPATKKLTH